jgi:hypothetical protein
VAQPAPTVQPWLLTGRGRASLAVAALLAFLACCAFVMPWHTVGSESLTAVSGTTPGPSHLAVPATLSAFAAIVAAALLLGSIRTRSEVSTDEGGVRWRRGGRSGYVPYAKMRDAQLASNLFGGRVLVLLTDDGIVRLALHDTRPSDLFGLILDRIAKKRTAAAPSAEVSGLARGDRDLATWLAAVRIATTRTSANEAYRTHAVDFDALERTLSDEAAAPDLRAAAAHALLGGDDEERARRVGVTIGVGAPPIVVAAAALAAGGRWRVEDGVIEEALGFLDEEDRVVVEAHARVGES